MAMRRPPAVARVLERVTATAREHEMFLPGQRCSSRCPAAPTRSACSSRSSGSAGCSDQARGLPLRSPAPPGLGGGRRVRRAPGGAPRLPFHLRAADDRPAQGRVGRGVGARAARDSGDRGGRARDRGDGTADGPHAGRPGRDGADGAGAGGGIEGMSGIAPVDRHVGAARCSTSRATRSRRSAVRCACGRGGTRRTPTPGSCATRSGSRAPRARARHGPERQRTARAHRGRLLREDADELTRQTFERARRRRRRRRPTACDLRRRRAARRCRADRRRVVVPLRSIDAGRRVRTARTSRRSSIWPPAAADGGAICRTG